MLSKNFALKKILFRKKSKAEKQCSFLKPTTLLNSGNFKWKQQEKDKYSCSGPPAFKGGSCRERFFELLLCYK